MASFHLPISSGRFKRAVTFDRGRVGLTSEGRWLIMRPGVMVGVFSLQQQIGRIMSREWSGKAHLCRMLVSCWVISLCSWMASGSSAQTASPSAAGSAADDGLGQHGFATSGDQRIHYVTKGEGPLIVMIHGFPDYWYTWRNQMPELSKTFQVVAMDQRGYNESSQPTGVESYAMDRLVEDVHAVVRHLGRDRATIVGHDWGGMVAWTFAMRHPEMVERLIVLNLPHPHGFLHELATNPEQQKNSEYARFFQQPDAAKTLKPETLAQWVKDDQARPKYVAAFERSSLEGMLNYYKANYPREPYKEPRIFLPRIQCPVLLIHGLKDKALLSGALNNTWNWIDSDLTLVTIPQADHFVQHDAADLVTRTMVSWLNR